jgi:hypothetical protein
MLLYISLEFWQVHELEAGRSRLVSSRRAASNRLKAPPGFRPVPLRALVRQLFKVWPPCAPAPSRCRRGAPLVDSEP